MSKDGIREIRKRVFYIICTLTFLIGSTIIWSNYKDKINLRRQIEYNNIFAMANEVEFREINNSIDVSSLGKVINSVLKIFLMRLKTFYCVLEVIQIKIMLYLIIILNIV